MAGVMLQESGGQPDVVSPAGAVGLMQVMPSDAPPPYDRWFRDRPTGAELLDPSTNVDWGCAILTGGYRRWGTLPQAIAAYFGAIDGEGRITGGRDATGSTGNRYVAAVLAHIGRFVDLDAEVDGMGDATALLSLRVAFLQQMMSALLAPDSLSATEEVVGRWRASCCRSPAASRTWSRRPAPSG